jgi:hypothetical protein
LEMEILLPPTGFYSCHGDFISLSTGSFNVSVERYSMETFRDQRKFRAE